MRITITVDADYTTPWEAEARLTFTDPTPNGGDDIVARINTETHCIVETLLAAINGLDDIQQMPTGKPLRLRTPLPERDAIITTRVTAKPAPGGLHLN
ncbi:hypothetical protein CWT12_12340 [Actinomyces sp. 432]|uniref:hypothetical protein n=1 Tax=Actinomyces sp. 432 TaxID=2057798 RepID=UPI0013742A95|nr:hypothetical protein [Actinomyces sp. 432]QHO91941.1 hypothetical protein CWT12_12340 [Actinomyces sp. 432]